MVSQMEKPRATEIKVRIDCKGCVQKIKKALNGITGIKDINIDLSQQKITIIGWADPEKLIKAIKKTRKNAVICSSEQSNDQPKPQRAPPPEPTKPPQTEAPPPEPTNPPQREAPPSEPTKPTQTEAPKEQPEVENQPESVNSTGQSHQDPKPQYPEEDNEFHQYRHPQDYRARYRGLGPVHTTQNHSTYKPSLYLTEYTYPRSPPRYSFYSNYCQEKYKNYGNSNITSMFSEDNPNACRIV